MCARGAEIRSPDEGENVTRTELFRRRAYEAEPLIGVCLFSTI